MENSDAKNIGIDINVDASGMDAGFAKADQKVNDFSTTLDKNKIAAEGVADKYSSLGLVLGGAVVVAAAAAASAIVTVALKSIDLADSLGKMSQRTGTSVEELAGLKFAADQSGASLELVARASKKLSTEMVQNPALFARMGIDAKDSTGALVQLAGIFEKMPAGIEKTAFASKLLGERMGAEMIPFLNQGSDSLAQLIEQGKKYYPITEQSAAQAEKFNDQMAELKLASSAAGIELANIFLPSLVKTTTAMTELSREGHPVLALFRGLGGIAQIPWDLLLPTEDLSQTLNSSAIRLKELRGELSQIEDKVKRSEGGGLLHKWLYGSKDELEQSANIIRNQIATLEKHAAELYTKKPAADKTTVDPADFAGNDKLLEQIRKFDEKMVDSHKSAFDRMIEDWVALQDKMIAKGAYGSKERAAHEAAYTIYVNEENEKRLAAEDKAREMKDKHLAAQLASEQAYFDGIAAAANENTLTESGRERVRYEKALIDHKKRRADAAADHVLDLNELVQFERAKENIAKISAERITEIEKTEADKKLKVEQQLTQAKISMASQAANAAAGFLDALGQKNSEMAKIIFIAQKALAIAQAIVNTEVAITGALATSSVVGVPAAAASAAWIGGLGYTSVALIAATALMEGAGGGRANGSIPTAQPGADLTSPPGGSSSGSGTAPPPAAQQPVVVNIYNTGNVLSPDYIDNTIIPQIRDNISNADVLIIDPRSRQAQVLGAV